MTTESSAVTVLRSDEEAIAHGRTLAAGLHSGAVVALCGPMGAGKTHLTKGLVAGLGSAAAVSSPTFGLVHEYEGGRWPVFHFDFYRVSSAAEVLAYGWDEYLERGGICIVEWADLYPELFPAHTQWWELAYLPEDPQGRVLRPLHHPLPTVSS
jgi:tRNA threonylcarbamoyladenosine biosynthesis protein TsaE